jgi:hypothetical protein
LRDNVTMPAAELPQAAEPRLSAIRKEIEACVSLLGRFNGSRAA